MCRGQQAVEVRGMRARQNAEPGETLELPKAAGSQRSAHQIPAEPFDREVLVGLEVDRGMQGP
jgi:hypothetical protein